MLLNGPCSPNLPMLSLQEGRLADPKRWMRRSTWIYQAQSWDSLFILRYLLTLNLQETLSFLKCHKSLLVPTR